MRRIVPKSTFRPPNVWRQLKVFFQRDLLSKLANRQYVLVNLLEAPVLAFIMAFFLRYNKVSHLGAGEYVFRGNDNLPQYLFISVIVALFLGLTVAAEEIIRDRMILQREKFLDLSRAGYLVSKVAILFLISAVQTLLFVLVGNFVLSIEGMTLPYWGLLFSTACFANVLGLNVSASFNSAKVIYIIIPVLIIPQLLFSGIIVKFDKLHPWFASEKSVPWIGNIMASRWAYEGLAVTQFKENEYERNFYAFDQRMRSANWKKDLWVRELRNSVVELRRKLKDPDADVDLEYHVDLLRHELLKESTRINGFLVPNIDRLRPDMVTEQILNGAEAGLDRLVIHYRAVYKEAERLKEARIAEMTATEELRADYFELLDQYRNESLVEFVTNKNDVNVITQFNGELIQKSDPVYLVPERGGLLEAHFYAPVKWLAGNRVSTFWANAIVLWVMSLALALMLYVEGFNHLADRLSRLVSRKEKE